MEHTHLVKGLDYALLNKVRSEIDKKPEAGDEADGKPRYSFLFVCCELRDSTVHTLSCFVDNTHDFF